MLREQGVSWALEGNETETLVVIDDAGLDEHVAERIETFYEELFAIDQASIQPSIVASPAPPQTLKLEVRLADGGIIRPELPIEIATRLLTTVAPEDLAALSNAILDALEEPPEPG